MSRNRPNVRPQASTMGGWAKFAYFASKAMQNLRLNRLVTILTVSTITIALLIISLFMLLYVNLEGTIEQWSRKVVVTVYFEKEPLPQELAALKARISALAGTETISTVSKEEALKRFRSRLKGQESLLEGVAPDILPSSIEITLKKEFRSTDAVNIYVSRLKRLQGIGEVQYGEEWVRKFLLFFQFVRILGSLIALFLLLSVTFIVSNTIRLTIFARKDELEILSLVGATPLFIKAPFLIEGMLQGAMGSLLAVTLLSASYFTILSNAGNFLTFNPADAGLVFLPVSHIAALVFGGVLIGFIGSLASLKKFITI